MLAMLPDDAQLTITVRKADLLKALEHRTDLGPENLSTAQAALRYGYSAERWRRWADAGQLEGAWQDARGGSWHLPLAVCERHIRTLQALGRTAVVRGASAVPSSRSVPRGPRRSRSDRPSAARQHRAATAADLTTFSLEAARAARP